MIIKKETEFSQRCLKLKIKNDTLKVLLDSGAVVNCTNGNRAKILNLYLETNVKHYILQEKRSNSSFCCRY